MAESGDELTTTRVVDLEGFFTNTWPSNKNIRLIPATMFLNEHADAIDNTRKNGISDGKKSNKNQTQSKANISRQDKNGVMVLLTRLSPQNSRLMNDVPGCPVTSTSITGEAKQNKARGTKRRGSAKDEDENGKKNKKLRSQVTSTQIQSMGLSSEKGKSAKGSNSNKAHSENKSESRNTKGEKNKKNKNNLLKSSKDSDSLELERTLNGDESQILKDIINTDGNSSMVLRPNRRYYKTMRYFDESDSDETWEGSAKKNKNKKQQQQRQKKNDATKGKTSAKSRAKENIDNDKENIENGEVQKSKRPRIKKVAIDGANDTNLPEEAKSNSKTIAHNKVEEKKNTEARKKKADVNDTTNGKPRAKGRPKKKDDDNKENKINGEVQKNKRARTKKADKDGSNDTNVPEEAISNTKTVAKKTVKEKKTTKGRKKQEESHSREGEVLKPEDCVITAKRGTLKYLEQREKLVSALAKDAEEDDDFFSTKEFGKRANIGQLVLAGAQDDTLSIKTPQGKGYPKGDCVITPRTALLQEWGVTEQRSTVYTPTTSSPVNVVSQSEKKDIMRTMYQHLKSRGKRPRGFRKQANENNSSLESVFQNAKKVSNVELPDLPEIPDLNDGDTSNDDYFNESETY